MLGKKVTMETCGEMPYLGCVIQEALRKNPVVPITSLYHFERDIVLGSYTIKAYDWVVINNYGLHHNSAQW